MQVGKKNLSRLGNWRNRSGSARSILIMKQQMRKGGVNEKEREKRWSKKYEVKKMNLELESLRRYRGAWSEGIKWGVSINLIGSKCTQYNHLRVVYELFQQSQGFKCGPVPTFWVSVRNCGLEKQQRVICDVLPFPLRIYFLSWRKWRK